MSTVNLLHMRPTFDKVTQGITDSDVIAFSSYIRTTWLESNVWSVDDLSVFGLTIRTNNDAEGWHRRLNERASRGHLQLYLMIQLLHDEASYVDIQVALISEGKSLRHVRRKYSRINDRLCELWSLYQDGELSTSKLLRRCSRLQLLRGVLRSLRPSCTLRGWDCLEKFTGVNEYAWSTGHEC
jgi:hypothetical protein